MVLALSGGSGLFEEAIAVLDRGWGKPQQAIEMDWRQKSPDQMTDEELIALIREMESLTSRANNGHS
jgi:hypothetical protein